MWTQVRITGYIAAGLAGAAAIASALNLGTYDAVTGMFDPAPFSVPMLAGIVAPVIASGVATVAAWFRWGQK